MTPNAAQRTAIDAALLPMWVIYDHPTHYPHGFIARMHVVGKVVGPTTAYVTGATLDEVRQQLPKGLYCIGRQDGDEPQIFEVWT